MTLYTPLTKGHGQALAKGIKLKSFMAEIFGRRDGCCKGKSGAMHIACKESGIAGSNRIAGFSSIILLPRCCYHCDKIFGQ